MPIRFILGLMLSLAASFARCDDKKLYIYNWADYIGSGTIAQFEKETGIKVVYDMYDSEDTMDARLLAGGSGYDIVSSSSNYFSREIKAGVFRPLDKRLLPGWKNLNPKALANLDEYDPGNHYAMPYLHSMNGFAYNADMIRARMRNAPVGSLDMIFKPEIAAKFADCGISFLDSAEDVLELALNYLHLDPNTTKREDYLAAQRLLLAVRPYIRSFDSVEFMNGLANRETCIAMSWSSDYATSMARARAAGIPLNLAFTVPLEGANQTFSGLLIAADAPHPHAAYLFLNFLLRPEIIAAITNEIHYGNDNLAANPLVDARIFNDESLYPTARIEARLYRTHELSAATERIRTRIWTRVKTAR